MANWKNFIKILVRLPYTTQGLTLDYCWYDLEITREDIWFSGDSDSLRWVAYFSIGEHRLLLSGKSCIKNAEISGTTTYKIQAWNTYDGIRKGREQYRTKVLSFG